MDFPQYSNTGQGVIQFRSLPFLMLIKYVIASALLNLAVVVPGRAAPFTAFRDGEVFTYRAGFGIFGNAGEIVIRASESTQTGVGIMSVATDTHTRGFVKALYEYHNSAEVIIETGTGRMLDVKEKGADPRRVTDTEIVFDYGAGLARYTDRIRPQQTTEVSIPAGNPMDLISALVQTRDWNLKPGDKRDLLVLFGSDFYPLTITAEEYEEVRTPLGVYQTLVLVPRMTKNPKGLFKKGGEIKVWISQDASNLPIKMQLKLNFGAVTLLLCDYKGRAAK